MDLSTARWLSELEMDNDPALNYQWPMMSTVDQSVNNDLTFDQFSSSDHESCSTHQSPHEASQNTSILKTSIQLINNNNDPTLICTSRKPSYSPSPTIISFGNDSGNFPATRCHQHHIEKPKYTVKTESDEMMMPLGRIDFSDISSINSFGEQHSALGNGVDPFKKGGCRTPIQAQDHVLAERKRRENLSQQFIALSAVVPGLKKLNTASVMGGAIKHIKLLEERVKFFEEEQKKRKARVESVVSAKRPRPSICCSTTNESSCDQQPPSAAKIDVTSSGGDVLISVQCKKQKGIMVGFFSEMESIHLSITSSSFMPFGDGMLLINAVAQIDKEFCVTEEALANNVRRALLKLL